MPKFKSFLKERLSAIACIPSILIKGSLGEKFPCYGHLTIVQQSALALACSNNSHNS